MQKDARVILSGMLLALLVVPAIAAYWALPALGATPTMVFGRLCIASGCTFLAYFLARQKPIEPAFIGGSALAAAAIQAWVLYGIHLSEANDGALFFELYLFCSLGTLIVSTLVMLIRPRWLFPTHANTTKYALRGGLATVLNYFITILFFVLLTR